MASPSWLPRGARIGPYTLLRHLARGGTSDVYAARRDGMDREVALKVLADLSPSDRARAEREAAIAATLDHPHIARVTAHHDADPDTLAIEMELLAGETLARRIARAPLTPAEVIAVAARTLDALAYAHDRGIVHRDVKPANLFVCEGDLSRIKLLDFGLARPLHAQRVTTPGRLVGTPAYMAPELIRGGREYDLSADLWAAAVTLYECVSGALPFEASSPLAGLLQVAFSRARRLDAVLPRAPRGLVALLDRALDHAPEARFASAREFADAVRALDLSAPGVTREAVVTPNAETRLVTVVLAGGMRDLGRMERLRVDDDARVVVTDLGVAAVFGAGAWIGDEPHRAVRLARALALVADSVAVITARVVDDGALPPEALARAEAILPARGVTVDGETARLVRDLARLTPCGAAVWTLGDDLGPDIRVERTPLVGRNLERALLVEAVLRARDTSAPHGALVLGERGMGRTRLLDAALDALRAALPGVTLLRARCVYARREVPFAALRDALGDHVHPGLAALLQTPSRGSDPQAAFDRARADLDAILARLADAGPVLIAIDDAHWLDAASRDLLRSVLGSAGYPVGVWSFADPEARAALQDLCPVGNTLTLAPLGRADAEAVVRAIAPRDDHSVSALLARAEGNPLALVALASAPADAALPVDVESALRASLDRLAAPEREFALCASVFGRAAPLDGVLALGAADLSDALRRRGWITLRASARRAGRVEVEFRNALLAEVARGVFTDVARASLHQRAAAWLLARPDAAPEELAAQWDLAGDPLRAAAAWAEATERASAAGAVEAACTHCARVLARSTEGALRWRALVARDEVLQMAGDRALQREGLDALLALAPALGGDARAEVAWRFVHHARMVGDDALAAAHRDAFARVDAPTRWRCAGDTELALLDADRGRLTDARVHAERAVSGAASLDDPWLRARAAHALAYVTFEEGEDLDAGIARYAAAAEDYARAGDRRREGITLVNRGAALASLGRLADALDCLDLALDHARAIGNHRAVAVSLENRGAVRRMLGDHDAARDDLESSLDRARALKFRRLAEAAEVDLLYLALATDAPAGELRARLDAVGASLGAGAGPIHDASARALVLRASHRLGEVSAEVIAEARATLAAEPLPPSARAELCAALWVADGGRAEDAGEFSEALAAATRRARDPEDAAIQRRGILRRYVVPEGLVALIR